MFVETVKSDGLSHLSYLVGNGGEAVVIDPRRDCELYVQLARARGCHITHVLETHRNEDLVSGAPVLARMTGAPVLHGPTPKHDIAYAKTVLENETLSLGSARIRVIETPGHTDDSLSFVLQDTDFGDDPIGVFTGDALFVGDVGRTDFYPQRAREVAGLLFDSLRKLVALGDQTIIYPAHGAGSVCGNNMADREFSTLGYERRNNPLLRMTDRDEFIATKLAEQHYQPPYFRLMEHLNSIGGEPVKRIMTPPSLSAFAFEHARAEAITIDIRDVTAFMGAHLPDSLALPCDMVPAFAGWFLEQHQDILLVADDAGQAEVAARHLARIGFDRTVGFLVGALAGWATGGRSFRTLPAVSVTEVARRVADSPEDWTLLDVRSASEIAGGMITGSCHRYVGELGNHLDTLRHDHRYTVMCGSGQRATIAASVLLRAGFSRVDVFLGSMGAWQAAGYPTIKAEDSICQ